MIAWWVLSHALVLLVGLGVGCRVRGRRRYNSGVAAGRRFAEVEHGYHHDPHLKPRPRRRFLPRSDVKSEPLVTRAARPYPRPVPRGN